MSFIVSHHYQIRPERVVLLGHGLNNPPSSMDNIGHWFEESIIIRLELSGHKKSSGPPLQNSWKSVWSKEMEEAIAFGQEISGREKIAFFFCGFSLSCTIWLYVIGQRVTNPFTKAIFLAPAIVSSPMLGLISFLKNFSFKIPSFNRSIHRIHSAIPSSMYLSLQEMIQDIQPMANLKIPLLMFLDRRDVLISPFKISKFILKKRLNAQLIKLNSYPHSFFANRGYHLLFDQTACGLDTWNQMSMIANNFFLHANHISTLPIAPYEHYFLNDQSERYPISIQTIIKFKKAIDQQLFMRSLLKGVDRHFLLRSLVSGRGVEKRKNLAWITLNTDINLLMTERFRHNEIYLQNEIALKCKFLDSKSVKLFFHHAAIDGMGVGIFIKDLLLTYAKLDEQLPSLNCELTNRFTPPQTKKTSILLALRYLIKFILFKPIPISSLRDINLKEGVPYSEIESLIVNEEETQSLLEQTKNYKLKFNTILLTALFNTLYEWNKRGNQKIRLSMPINHRNRYDENLSACNKTGIYFIDRKLKRKLNLSDAYLIDKEMGLARYFGLSFLFNRMMAFMGLFKYGLKILIPDTKKEICATTSCLSNLGIFDTTELNQFKDKIDLDEIIGVAPIRAGTRATFGVISLWRRLHFNVHYDTSYFTKNDAHSMLTLYIKEIKMLLEIK